MGTSGGSCASNVTFTVTASDNCGTANVTCAPASGSPFALGATTVNCFAEDGHGNTNTCSFTITVTDTEAPALTCAGNASVSTSGGSCASDVTFSVTATDNCGTANVTCSPASGSSFALGATTVNCMADDGRGNTNTCAFTVTVVDDQAPAIACAPVTLPASPGLCGRTNFVLTLAATNDNCGILSVTNDAPSLLPLGDTIVTWLVLDVHGNSNTCQQTVTVTEVDLPILTALTSSATNQLGASVVLSVTATSCAGVTYQWCKEGAVLPGATAATLTLHDMVHADTGDYTAKVCNGAGCVTSAVARVTVNRPPIANDGGAATTQNQVLRIAHPKLLNNDTDADGDALTVTGVSAMSTNGGSVTLDATQVTYTPQPGFIGTDRFSYTISDGRGGSATADVVVLVVDGALPGQNQMTLVPRPGGMLIRFAGIPGSSYALERSGQVTGPWGTLTTLTAPIHGIMEYLDATPPPGMGFYRTVSP